MAGQKKIIERLKQINLLLILYKKYNKQYNKKL